MSRPLIPSRLIFPPPTWLTCTPDTRSPDILSCSPIIAINRGEPWHRLRQDDLSQVDFPVDTSTELRGLLVALLRSNPAARIDSGGVCEHPVVVRTRAAMERLVEEAQRAGEPPFTASPLAGVPAGFLAGVLGHDPAVVVTATETSAGDAMDVGA